MRCGVCGGINDNVAAVCGQCGHSLTSQPRDVGVSSGGNVARVTAGSHTAAPSALATPPRVDSAALVFLGPLRGGERVELASGTELTIGRTPENALVLDDDSVSRAHARISFHDGQFLVEDLHSKNGTWLNGAALAAPTPLCDGDHLRLGAVDLQVEVPSRAVGAPPEAESDYLSLVDGQRLPLTGKDLYVGRAPTNDLVLDDPTISRQHARLQHLPQGWLLTDLDSSNGTEVNQVPLTGPVFLAAGDVIQFGTLAVTYHQRGVSDRSAGRTVVVRGRDGALVVEREAPQPPGLVVQPRPGPPLLALRDVVKTYRTGAGSLTVLKGVSLSIQPGEFVAIVGPSGCGKSTLLNVITGIDRPDSGQVSVQGQDILRLGTDALARWRGRNLGIVFQFFQLLPTLTVAENVMLPMAFCNTYRGRQRRERALEVLRLVGMDHVADRLPSALSGGQQQRIAIARALANDPPVLVSDEPTGNLDSATSQQMFELFASLVANGKTMLMVTHDPVLARAVPRRIEMLDGAIV